MQLETKLGMFLLIIGVALFFPVILCSCNFKKPVVNPRDYQIEVYNDTTWLYDGDRLVGKYIDTTWNTPIAEIIAKDNQ